MPPCGLLGPFVLEVDWLFWVSSNSVKCCYLKSNMGVKPYTTHRNLTSEPCLQNTLSFWNCPEDNKGSLNLTFQISHCDKGTWSATCYEIVLCGRKPHLCASTKVALHTDIVG